MAHDDKQACGEWVQGAHGEILVEEQSHSQQECWEPPQNMI